MEKSLGGNRIGSGNKMNVNLHGFERSSHNLSRVWRSSMSCGTLVPFLTEIGLPGDTFDIDLNTMVRTQPTVAPLFGSFKLQLDVFSIPVRLFNAELHMNKLGVGLNMANIKLPQLKIDCNDMEHFDQSSLLAYLGTRGAPKISTSSGYHFRKSALELLSYWSIYKHYYANKMEDEAYYIVPNQEHWEIETLEYQTPLSAREELIFDQDGVITTPAYNEMIGLFITLTPGLTANPKNISIEYSENNNTYTKNLNELGIVDAYTNVIYVYLNGTKNWQINAITPIAYVEKQKQIKLKTFGLSNIDEVQLEILKADSGIPYVIDSGTQEPYSGAVGYDATYSKSNNSYSQNGLAIKTYQSDIFNNWLSTSMLDNINSISAVDTSGGSFSMDTLNLAKKVYDMLNRVAVSGGSYQDWMEAVYGEDSVRNAESPIYCGGLSTEIIFEEIVSTADAVVDNQNVALGSLAGKGTQSRDRKGGKVVIKCNEPSIIMGIVSITPRIDYSQGNKWFTNLETMDDFHKPSLDGIGFQELITEQMMHQDATYNVNTDEWTFKSAGKQPAWLNYMTAYNETYGHFADQKELMGMTLNRQYDFGQEGGIADLTTYIDPTKFNYAFAVESLDAQNFWVQIASDITARRKMSAKIIPNL